MGLDGVDWGLSIGGASTPGVIDVRVHVLCPCLHCPASLSNHSLSPPLSHPLSPTLNLPYLTTMASLFNFSSPPIDIDILLTNSDDRRQVEVKSDKDKKESCPVYYDGESVVGQVVVRVKDGKRFVHDGIRLELVGSIGELGVVAGWNGLLTVFEGMMMLEMFYDR
jgi:hypothetical protein